MSFSLFYFIFINVSFQEKLIIRSFDENTPFIVSCLLCIYSNVQMESKLWVLQFSWINIFIYFIL